MAVYRLAVVLGLLLVLIKSGVEAGTRVKVDVYYESLCPDSKRFVQKQLQPNYDDLASKIQVEFIPYGNAHVSGEPGNYKFRCQHGPEECRGNIIQTCSIPYMNNTKDSIEFIACAFNSKDQGNSITDCVNDKNLGAKIQKCANGVKGNNLEKTMAEKTEKLDPPQNFIPWITFNGKGSEDINYKANSDFVGTVCEYIQGKKPDICKSRKRPVSSARRRYYQRPRF